MENYNYSKSADEIIDEIDDLLPEINIEKGLANCVSDSDFYIEIFTDFTNLDIKDALEKLLETNNSLDYCTRIHGFKSNAYCVGATALGDLAYEMEKMSREGLPEEIRTLQSALFEKYDRICLCFREITQD